MMLSLLPTQSADGQNGLMASIIHLVEMMLSLC